MASASSMQPIAGRKKGARTGRKSGSSLLAGLASGLCRPSSHHAGLAPHAAAAAAGVRCLPLAAWTASWSVDSLLVGEVGVDCVPAHRRLGLHWWLLLLHVVSSVGHKSLHASKKKKTADIYNHRMDAQRRNYHAAMVTWLQLVVRLGGEEDL